MAVRNVAVTSRGPAFTGTRTVSRLSMSITEAPEFVSNKIDQSVLVFGAINGYLFNTFRLK